MINFNYDNDFKFTLAEKKDLPKVGDEITIDNSWDCSSELYGIYEIYEVNNSKIPPTVTMFRVR